MASLRTVGKEALALGAFVASMPLRFLLADERFDPEARHPTPVVLVHGLFGDPTNFLAVQRYLAACGIRNLVSFSYGWRLDYQRLAVELGDAIEELCRATGTPAVDVIGHSLGGLVGRYLLELEPEGRVRRLVTLGAPYFATPLPPGELAVFGDCDPFIAAPHPSWKRAASGVSVVVPDCGHWGLLYSRTALHATAAFLGGAEQLEIPARSLALEAS